MVSSSKNFKQIVEELVATIPKGKVMTYGQIAGLCGQPRAARIVGGIAHFGNPNLPWQRVVNRKGAMASGYPGGRKSQKSHLETEGVKVSDDYLLELSQYLYIPKTGGRK